MIILPWFLFEIIGALVFQTNWGSVGLHTFILVMCLGLAYQREHTFSVALTINFLLLYLFPFSENEGQRQYYDRIVDSRETRKGTFQEVQWRNDSWHYYNGILQYSTVDQHIWQEAYIQPVMQLVSKNASVCLIGGESDILQKELWKFGIVPTVFPYDSEDSNETIAGLLGSSTERFDLIIVDLPDPINVEYGQYYSTGFYGLCFSTLKEDGMIVSHAGGLYSKASQRKTIWKNAESAGFETTPYHTQIPTIGQWTWFIGTKSSLDVKARLRNIVPKTETKWWDQEAMDMMLSFGHSDLLRSR